MKKGRKIAALTSLLAMTNAISGNMTIAMGEAETPVIPEENKLNITTRNAQLFDKVANVQGSFAYDQNVISPADSMFDVFGTAMTGVCSTPGDVKLDGAQTDAHYFINVGGNVNEATMVDFNDLAEKKSTSRILSCSCGMGHATMNAVTTGVLLKDLIAMTDVNPDANTVTVYSADGYGKALPLQYALDHEAMLVYKVNDKELTPEEGAPVQLWMPSTVAKYFTRNVASVELTHEEKVPEIDEGDPQYRAKINILNFTDGLTFKAGKPITFEGYADDCGSPIAAVEFSMDGGETWTICETPDTTTYKWVYWQFTYTPEKAGAYQLTARAKTENGMISPLSSSVLFSVE